ncbi:MAG: metallophosphoesterase [Bacilli bacterium]|nr:metallophosphoesterase [Bacilli bacterium]
MIVHDYSSISKLFLVGDIHGEFSEFFNNIKSKMPKQLKENKKDVHPLVLEEEKEDKPVMDGFDFRISRRLFDKNSKNGTDYSNSVIIVAGDCGIGFNKLQYYIDTFKNVNKLLEINNSFLLFIRGNHDDPSYFTEDKFGFSNIKCLSDYSIVKTKEYTTLCVGGGISIDRIWRKTQESRINRFSHNNKKSLYWENEQVIYDESLIDEIVSNGIVINSVISHSCPSNMFPIDKHGGKSWFKLDKNLLKDIREERENLLKIYNKLRSVNQKPIFWAYGHFHINNQIRNEDDIMCFAMDDRKFLNDIESLSDRCRKFSEISGFDILMPSF